MAHTVRVHVRLGRSYFEMPLIVGAFVFFVFWLFWLAVMCLWLPIKGLWLLGVLLVAQIRESRSDHSLG